jgi:hypothetical protein
MGFVPPRGLQTQELDAAARNSVWNLFHICCIERSGAHSVEHSSENATFTQLWWMVFQAPLHSIPFDVDTFERTIFPAYTKLTWFQVMEFVEVCAKHNLLFRTNINGVLESESVAYRLVGGYLVPLTSAVEVQEVEEARKRTGETPLAGARVHLDSALEKLGERPKPDVRNAIKEAISAVEAVARTIDGKATTLGDALKRIEVGANPALRQGFEKLYGWTNGPDGIRHAMMDDETSLALEDARFMVVTCSAFVNYLLVKADRVGVKV